MAGVIRCSILGTLPGGEDWSVNPCFDVQGGSVINYSEVNAIVAAVNGLTVPTSLLSAMSVGTIVTGCRVESRTYAGELQQLAEGLRATGTPGQGTSPHPGQISWVVSLRSLTPGGTGRGRLYWPANGVTISTASLRPTTSLTSQFLNGMLTYLTAIEAAIDGAIDETVNLAVWSRKNDSTSAVTRLLAGDILDTQRRRRDSLPEAYSEVSYV